MIGSIPLPSPSQFIETLSEQKTTPILREWRDTVIIISVQTLEMDVSTMLSVKTFVKQKSNEGPEASSI